MEGDGVLFNRSRIATRGKHRSTSFGVVFKVFFIILIYCFLFHFFCPRISYGAISVEPFQGSKWTTPNGVERYLPHVKRGDYRKQRGDTKRE